MARTIKKRGRLRDGANNFRGHIHALAARTLSDSSQIVGTDEITPGSIGRVADLMRDALEREDKLTACVEAVCSSKKYASACRESSASKPDKAHLFG